MSEPSALRRSSFLARRSPPSQELTRLWLIPFALCCSNAFAAGSLCESSEAVVFACQVVPSRKLVSLCASKDLGPGVGHVSYRFGTPGKIELEFPRRDVPESALQFRYAHYFRFQVDRTEISFKVGEYSYSVFSYYEGGEKPPRSEGVRVGRGQRETVLRCAGKSKADFSRVSEVIPCDEENALASCR